MLFSHDAPAMPPDNYGIWTDHLISLAILYAAMKWKSLDSKLPQLSRNWKNEQNIF